MDCRYCEEPMEREDGYIINTAEGITNKCSTYACMTCGRTYLWELHVPGLKPLFDPKDFLPPEPPWREDP